MKLKLTQEESQILGLRRSAIKAKMNKKLKTKKLKIKKLKRQNAQLENKLSVANMDCNIWESKYNDLEKIENGFVKIPARDYEILVKGGNVEKYKIELAQTKQLLHEANFTKDKLKEKVEAQEKVIESLQFANKRISNLLEPNYAEQDESAQVKKSICEQGNGEWCVGCQSIVTSNCKKFKAK